MAELTAEQRRVMADIEAQITAYAGNVLSTPMGEDQVLENFRNYIKHYVQDRGLTDVDVVARHAWSCPHLTPIGEWPFVLEDLERCDYSIPHPIWWHNPIRWLRLRIWRYPGFCERHHWVILEPVVQADMRGRFPHKLEYMFATIKIK